MAEIDSFKEVKPNTFKFTDDTALTRAVCNSLIECKGLNVSNMVNSLSNTYHKEPNRGYAFGAMKLFENLNDLQNLERDCFKYSLEMFNGTGSYGNGSAMRITPIALYTAYKIKSFDETLLAINLATKLTHSNNLAVLGAILQSFAVSEALKSPKNNSKENLDSYFEKIIKIIEKCESLFDNGFEKSLVDENKSYDQICSNSRFYLNTLASHSVHTKCGNLYSKKLKKLKKLLIRCSKGEIVDMKKFYEKFCDCGVKSYESIPVALFAFMVAVNNSCANEVDSKLRRNNTFECYGHIERVILYAISLGGDTDTIASMAGSIAGAYFGLDATKTENVFKSCESYDDAIMFADELFNLSVDNKSKI